MSRSTLAVVALLVAVSLLGWFQPWRPGPTPAPFPAPRPTVATPAPPPLPQVTTAEPEAAAPVPPTPATIRDAGELAAFLAARGLDPERALAELAAWRARRGFAGAEPHTGLATDPGATDYVALDPGTLAALAANGEAGAVAQLALRRLPADPAGAIDGLADAAALGSAAALLEIGGILEDLAALPAGGSGDAGVDARIAGLRGGDPGRDLRIDALAWRLASVRLYGPGIIDRSQLVRLEESPAELGAEAVAIACGQSLAIMADLGARGAPRGDLPPAFISEPGVYARLPCGDSAVPIAPPAAIERCPRTRVRDGNGQTFVVWTCRDN